MSEEFKAFIGNLPFDAHDGDVETILRSLEWDEDTIRRCEIKLIRDRETDNFKGFCYVTFPSLEHLEAVLGLNGVLFSHRSLKIDRATARSSDRGGRGGGRGRGGFGGGHQRGEFGGANQRGEFGGGNQRGGRGGRGGGFRNNQGGGRRYSRSEDSEAPTERPNEPAQERPRLNIAPRTTDPAALEAMRKKDEEEAEKRRAKLFGQA